MDSPLLLDPSDAPVAWPGALLDDAVSLMDGTGRWKAREVTYIAGKWKSLARLVPQFHMADFQVTPDCPSNPYLRAIVREPIGPAEREIPVATVSSAYGLVQHSDVVSACLEGLRRQGIDADSLKCELGLSALGEWMNFRTYLPERWSYMPRDGYPIDLRLECYNSVDGSSRLVILLGWYRFICTNGLIIGETKAELKEVHNGRLDVGSVPDIIAGGLRKAKRDLGRLEWWESLPVNTDRLRNWVDTELTDAWNKKAACRVWHICRQGMDVDWPDPFAPGKASEKPVVPLIRVPGSPERAGDLFDVSQAMSWVATQRTNVEERLEWQSQIEDLIEKLTGPMPAEVQQGRLFDRASRHSD